MQTKHVVGLSGGKDSTALALLLVETEPRQYEFICNTTGDELPDMFDHWKRLEDLLGSEIKQIRHERGLFEEIRQQKMLPSVFARWCTKILKIQPTIKYMESLPEGSTLYVGLRADEEARRGIYGEDMLIRFPLREHGMDEKAVWDYLNKRGIEIPKRTDCAACPYQRLGEWRDLYFNHPERYIQCVQIEDEIGATIRSPGRDTWPADLRSLGEEFAKGRKLREYKRATTCRVCSL